MEQLVFNPHLPTHDLTSSDYCLPILTVCDSGNFFTFLFIVKFYRTFYAFVTISLSLISLGHLFRMQYFHFTDFFSFHNLHQLSYYQIKWSVHSLHFFFLTLLDLSALDPVVHFLLLKTFLY